MRPRKGDRVGSAQEEPLSLLAFQNYQLLMFVSEGTKLLFVLAFGACIGSLVNVLVYRLPLGLDVVSPPSRSTGPP